MTLRRSSIAVLALFGYLFTGGLFGVAARVLCIKPDGHAAVELDCARCCPPKLEPRPGCGEHGCAEVGPAAGLVTDGCCDCLDIPVLHEPHLTPETAKADSESGGAAVVADVPVSFRPFDLDARLASYVDRAELTAPPLRAEILRC